MSMIKVLMVAGSMHVGGIENQLMHLVRNADRETFQIDFTSTMPDAACREEIEALGGRFLLIPDMNWKKPLSYCRAMYSIMKNGNYDVVHAHELFHSGITMMLAQMAGIPSRFVHAHNWCDDDGSGRKRSAVRSMYNAVMRKLIHHCSTVQIACSTWAGRFVYGEKRLQKDSYHLVYNSVDTAKFLDCYAHHEEGEFCKDGWINVLNVARMTTVKNQLFLVQIAEEFKKRDKKIRILCAGNGDEAYVSAVREAIREKQLEEYICLLGVRRDIDVLMRKSAAFVLPSKYEGMPLVMIEAQASGLHCVSADTYSPEVDFGIGTVTWLSLSAGAAVWADALERAAEQGRAPKDAVQKAVSEKKFDAKMFTQTLCDLYKEDCSRRKGRHD